MGKQKKAAQRVEAVSAGKKAPDARRRCCEPFPEVKAGQDLISFLYFLRDGFLYRSGIGIAAKAGGSVFESRGFSVCPPGFMRFGGR
jgi:hypothetical protein